MKIPRLASLVLVSVLASGLVAVEISCFAIAAAASAAPEFKPTGASVTGTGGTAIFTGAGEIVKCAKDTSTATITSSTLVGGITVHFLECTFKPAAGGSCPVMSPGAPQSNLILTNTLRGVLGLILPKPASGSDVALVLGPVTGQRQRLRERLRRMPPKRRRRRPNRLRGGTSRYFLVDGHAHVRHDGWCPEHHRCGSFYRWFSETEIHCWR